MSSESHKVSAKKFYWKNRDSEIVRNGEWRKANRERRNSYMREWVRKDNLKNPEKWKSRRRQYCLKAKYGITEDKYLELLEKQGGKCALCDKRAEDERHGVLRIDHCHDTGRVRGLLCDNHNLAIGKIGDTEEAILKILEYIRGENGPKD